MNATIGILSAGYYLPPTRKTVADIFRDEPLPADPSERLPEDIDFLHDIGIETIRTASQESATSVALNAARAALDQAGIDPGDIDLVVDFTSIPEDYVAPTWSAAGFVQAELGAKRAFAMAVNTGGCACYHVALKTVWAMMAASDRLNTALLFSGDKTPRYNHSYYPITVVCDGGSAIILRKNVEKRRLLAVEVATVGDLHDVLYAPGFAYRDPHHPDPEKYLHMTGSVKQFNAKVIPINLFMFRKVMRAAMRTAGIQPQDIAYYVYPTFSSWDQKSFCQGFRVPPERISTEGLGRHGHLQENDGVMNYVDAVEQGHIHDGDLVMVLGNGAGFTWGAAIIRH